MFIPNMQGKNEYRDMYLLKLIDISKAFLLYKNTDHIGFPWDTLMRKASVVCPERVLPLLSTIVPDTNTGQVNFSFLNSSSMAKRAAFELAVSNIVSTRRTSAPPSNNPLACSV